MTDLTIAQNAHRLTREGIEQYNENGYVKNLPLFDQAEVENLQKEFMEMVESVPDSVDIYRLNNWHKANRWFYELGRTPAILDCVEDLIGPDFNQWGGAFFIKFPHDETMVPFHQDASYWPLDPNITVTVWLAVFDADQENGCMRIVPGSHRWGDIPHADLPDSPDWSKMSREEVSKSKYVLWQQVDPDSFTDDQVVDMDLKAGEISLHDDDLIHGSSGNTSDRMRAGITFRYSPTEVKCDLSVWPNFEVYPVRGTDRFQHNPVGKVPTRNGYPTSFNQRSSAFE
jgi:chlorinating enzyme